MFERFRIGGCIYDMIKRLNAQGSPVDVRVVNLYRPFLDIAADAMKKQKITPDHAAIAFLVLHTQTLYKSGELLALREDKPVMFFSVLEVYQAARGFALLDQAKYPFARHVLNTEIAEALEAL